METASYRPFLPRPAVLAQQIVKDRTDLVELGRRNSVVSLSVPWSEGKSFQMTPI